MTVLFPGLGTVSDAQQKRRATPKHKITPTVIAKKQRAKLVEDRDQKTRDAVWARDKSTCRATGVPLLRASHDDKRAGEVDHAELRSTHPEAKYDVSNQLLVSRELNRLRKVACVARPDLRVFDYSGPKDRGKPQTFTFRDYKTGRVKWTRKG